MTRDELLPRFQELCPGCYFCKAKHGGEGFEDQRVEDIVNGIEVFIGAYLCPACLPRMKEMHTIERGKSKRRFLIETLKDANLFEFDQKYRLQSLYPEHRTRNPSVFEVVDRYPLESNLWLHSLVCGIGKSHILRSIGNRYVWDLKPVAMITGPKFRDIAEEWGQKRAALVTPYETAELLIIDDIDKALRWTENSLESLWSILDSRERKSKRTLITSQKTPTAFFAAIDKVAGPENKFSESIADRLRPLATFEMKGQPRRG